eukprot:TRINITY_DN14446_c0_g1_i1.p1 TRINITY_DN14446_c0_g1~~TRINITY_DN14446_c0_g1_i1.p1  ORF type:complete len:456 (-),score=52.77 TRINITY_DN14446_c0_g1_i1:100-1467(-)
MVKMGFALEVYFVCIFVLAASNVPVADAWRSISLGHDDAAKLGSATRDVAGHENSSFLNLKQNRTNQTPATNAPVAGAWRSNGLGHGDAAKLGSATRDVAGHENSSFLNLKQNRTNQTPDDDWPMRSEFHMRVRDPREDLLGRDEPDSSSKTQGPIDRLKQVLLDVGGGTGAGVGATGNGRLDHVILRRMKHQDKVVLLLLFLVYMLTLAFSASLAYRQSSNNSAVQYYADPRISSMAVESNDFEDFLDAFDHGPKDVQLRVSGLVPIPPFLEHMFESTVEHRGSWHRVVFSFALDLSPWLMRTRASSGDDSPGTGMSQEDLETLRQFVAENTNDLATVDIAKEVSWEGWEELATNIKQKIRQQGFGGLVHVSLQSSERVTVHKNRAWANFLHNRITKVIIALSMFGWFAYGPYMWLRNRGPKVTSKFRVNVDIAEYWQLISDKIGADGFTAAAS